MCDKGVLHDFNLYRPKLKYIINNRKMKHYIFQPFVKNLNSAYDKQQAFKYNEGNNNSLKYPNTFNGYTFLIEIFYI